MVYSCKFITVDRADKFRGIDQSAWIYIGMIRVEQRLEFWGVHWSFGVIPSRLLLWLLRCKPLQFREVVSLPVVASIGWISVKLWVDVNLEGHFGCGLNTNIHRSHPLTQKKAQEASDMNQICGERRWLAWPEAYFVWTVVVTCWLCQRLLRVDCVRGCYVFSYYWVRSRWLCYLYSLIWWWCSWLCYGPVSC